MIQQQFSIYDAKAKAYLTPFYMPNIDMAKRIFADCANDPNHQFNKHPSDFILTHTGAFDNETAQNLPQLPTPLGMAIEFQEGSKRFENMEEEINTNSTIPFVTPEDIKRKSVK